MTYNNSILFLALNIFNQTGGIQKVCRTICYALETTTFYDNAGVLSLYDDLADTKYISQHRFKSFKGFLPAFILRSITRGLNDTTIIISHINLLSIALIIKFLNRKSKIIMLAHGTEVWRRLPSWKKRFIQKHVHIWAVSNFTGQILSTRHQISNKVQILNNCLDPFFKLPGRFDKSESLLKKYHLKANQPVLLSICRLHAYECDKGYDQVIRSMKTLLNDFPDLHYLLCGQSDRFEINRLRDLINKNDLQGHVSLPGFIPEKELTDHYLLADVFILPSKKEGFGLVFIEAAACGCQIISGNSDGSTDAMLGGKLGKMVDPLNLQELNKAIIESLKSKHNKAAQQKLALKHFGCQQYLRKVNYMLINDATKNT